MLGRVAWFAAVASLAVSSCGGDTDGAGSGSASDAQVQDFCEAQCEARTRCPDSPEPEPTCTGDCVDELGVLAANMRADLIRGFAACLRSLECGTNDDVCMEPTLEAAGYDVQALVDSPQFQRCLDKENECDGTEGDFSDDACGTQFFLTASAQRAFAACLERPCEQVRDCLAPIIGN